MRATMRARARCRDWAFAFASSGDSGDSGDGVDEEGVEGGVGLGVGLGGGVEGEGDLGVLMRGVEREGVEREGGREEGVEREEGGREEGGGEGAVNCHIFTLGFALALFSGRPLTLTPAEGVLDVWVEV